MPRWRATARPQRLVAEAARAGRARSARASSSACAPSCRRGAGSAAPRRWRWRRCARSPRRPAARSTSAADARLRAPARGDLPRHAVRASIPRRPRSAPASASCAASRRRVDAGARSAAPLPLVIAFGDRAAQHRRARSAACARAGRPTARATRRCSTRWPRSVERGAAARAARRPRGARPRLRRQPGAARDARRVVRRDRARWSRPRAGRARSAPSSPVAEPAAR